MYLLKKITRRLPIDRSPFILFGGAATGLIFLGLLWLFLFYGTETPARNELLAGRLHPVVVHLPIGILLAVFLYELTTVVYPELRNLPITLFLIWVGFLTAVVSALAGFFLSFTGGYDASYLFWHKWLGVGVAFTSGLCFLLAGLEYLNQNNRRHSVRYRNLYRSVLVCMVVFLSITGHLGGTLTHGPGYITEYLPAFVKGPLGLDRSASVTETNKIQDIQQAEIYGDLVKPVLDEHCVSCHGPSKKKGDLRLDTKEGIENGGENGAIIQPNNPEESELVRRITLPPYHEKVMPPDSKDPLSIGNTELIRWWVSTGASFEKTVAEVDNKTILPAVQTKMDRLTAKPEPERFFAYDTDVPAPDPSTVQKRNTSSLWNLSYLSEKKRFLNVRVKPDHASTISRSDMNKLQPVRKQVTWLDLRTEKLTDDAWAFLKQLPLLNRLHVQQTNIDDSHLKHLSSHEYLTFLNLNRTGISDRGLNHLNYQPLDRLIVWQTDVSDEKIDELSSAHPKLDIRRGVSELEENGRVVSYHKPVSASNVYKGQTDRHGPKKAVDKNPSTRWATDGDARSPWIKMDLEEPVLINEIEIDEAIAQRIQSHTLEYQKDNQWKSIYNGETVGANFERSFDSVECRVVRLNIHESTNGPTINEIRLYGPEE